MSEHIQITDNATIKTIRFNRANKKNAITQSMYDAMADGIDDANQGDTTAIVILGQPGVFCAGNDITDFMTNAMSSDFSTSPTIRFLKALATSKKPLIAGLDGMAIGIGATMLLHCDMVFASQSATLKTPFLNLGVVPEAASSLIAPRIMGPQRAFEMLIMGTTFTAEDAQKAGIINHVVSSDEVEEKALAAARILSELPPEALTVSRGLLRGSLSDILARIDEEAALFTQRLKSEEAREAFTAFLEKRPANFKKLN